MQEGVRCIEAELDPPVPILEHAVANGSAARWKINGGKLLNEAEQRFEIMWCAHAANVRVGSESELLSHRLEF